MSAYTDEELATLARQCHEYMAPHDSPTHYNDEGLCDQCVVIVRWFAGAVLPDHDRQLRADTLNELADNLVRLRKQLDEAPTGSHVLELSWAGDGYPSYKILCKSEPGSRCRLECAESCGNEYIPCYTLTDDDDERYHELVDGKHPPGECNVTLFINESGDIPELHTTKGPHKTLTADVTYEWDGDNYLWQFEEEAT